MSTIGEGVSPSLEEMCCLRGVARSIVGARGANREGVRAVQARGGRLCDRSAGGSKSLRDAAKPLEEEDMMGNWRGEGGGVAGGGS